MKLRVNKILTSIKERDFVKLKIFFIPLNLHCIFTRARPGLALSLEILNLIYRFLEKIKKQIVKCALVNKFLLP